MVRITLIILLLAGFTSQACADVAAGASAQSIATATIVYPATLRITIQSARTTSILIADARVTPKMRDRACESAAASRCALIVYDLP